jgi:Mrp family chromosome partitioning ATPase
MTEKGWWATQMIQEVQKSGEILQPIIHVYPIAKIDIDFAYRRALLHK